MTRPTSRSRSLAGSTGVPVIASVVGSEPVGPVLDWALCRTFLAVTRSGSLAEAARRLGQSHPTVRRQVDQLERLFGAPLFLRSRDGAAPTPAALDVMTVAEEMERAANAFAARLGRGCAPAVIRVAAEGLIGTHLLPRTLVRLHAGASPSPIELVANCSDRDLAGGRAHLAVSTSPPSSADVVGSRVGALRYGYFARSSRRGSHREGDDTAEEHRERLVVVAGRTNQPILGSRGGRTEPRVALTVADEGQLLGAVLAGMGIGLLPISLGRAVERLVRVLPELEVDRPVWLSVSPDVRRAPNVRLAMDAIRRDARTWNAA